LGTWRVDLEWIDQANVLNESRPTQVDAIARNGQSPIPRLPTPRPRDAQSTDTPPVIGGGVKESPKLATRVDPRKT
jgi:hypothetical protein